MPRGDGRKNHSVNRERSRDASARNGRAKHNRMLARKEWMRKLNQARAYWRGENENHP